MNNILTIQYIEYSQWFKKTNKNKEETNIIKRCSKKDSYNIRLWEYWR